MRRSERLWRGSGCLRHKKLLHQNPVQRLTARCWAGGMAIDFFWSGGGINLVRTLVPIAVNCSKNPGVTNAAPCTFLHEGREADFRCVLEERPKWAESRLSAARRWTCSFSGSGHSPNWHRLSTRCTRRPQSNDFKLSGVPPALSHPTRRCESPWRRRCAFRKRRR